MASMSSMVGLQHLRHEAHPWGDSRRAASASRDAAPRARAWPANREGARNARAPVGRAPEESEIVAELNWTPPGSNGGVIKARLRRSFDSRFRANP